MHLQLFRMQVAANENKAAKRSLKKKRSKLPVQDDLPAQSNLAFPQVHRDSALHGLQSVVEMNLHINELQLHRHQTSWQLGREIQGSAGSRDAFEQKSESSSRAEIAMMLRESSAISSKFSRLLAAEPARFSDVLRSEYNSNPGSGWR